MKKASVWILALAMVMCTGPGLDLAFNNFHDTQANFGDAAYAGSRRSSRPSYSRPSRPTARPTQRPTQKKAVPSKRPTSSAKPSSKYSSTNKATSSKPTSKKVDSKASTAKAKQTSKATYKPSSAPKSSYKSKSGKTVNIDPNSSSTKNVRSMSSNDYANRSTRVERHYHTHYGDRYDYYRSQPHVYVGGGYSSLFWYSMMDWSLERRAMWLYHNQHSINAQLYQQQLQNAQLQAQIAQLQAQGVARNPNYVDSEYANSPDLMYSDEYVTAAYNPVATPVVRRSAFGPGTILGWFFTFVIIIGVTGALYYFIFVKKYD